MDYAEKSRKFQQYMDGLEEERRKIQMFQRELPLCLELVTQAIDSCRQKLVASELHLGRSDCEETSSEGPVLEEFMPLKRSSSEEEEQYELESKERQENTGKKPDWLRLGNRDPDPPSKEDLPRKPLAVVTKNGGGAFQPFYKEKRAPTPSTAIAAASSSAETGGREEKEGQGLSNRKTRRCWSPELHRRFLHALQQLGGSHAATPKQIRELMKVDGLTNDEVKSHLQKYRLHTRRPSPPGAMQSSSSNNNGQGPQFVVVGGIWVPPPPEYTVAVTGQRAEGASNRIYAPIAAAPLQPFVGCEKQQAQPSLKRPLYSSEGRSSREERSLGADDNANSNSPASSSSSSHATTGSPAF